jgi:hypothetical protein
MWTFDQTKFSLTLAQKHPYKIGVIDLSNMKISTKHYIKVFISQTHFNKFYYKKFNSLSIFKFERNFYFSP